MNESSASISVKYQIVSPWFEMKYLPNYATSESAGMDLHACCSSDISFAPGQRQKVPTGLAIEMPNLEMVGLVFARSGLAWRHGLSLPNGVGVIDRDYTGELQVLLQNFGETSVVVKPGDRIAQLVFMPIYRAEWIQATALRVTARGEGGFGSTGV
ncbi:MAG: dUTP diphosphatase [Alicyclobacillaceae bacterium]|nr:dUTP diphosphatase [Alicyclobacillaceae bacterium]MCY0896923.1 dUTP diphosphatase [Alicyclobacillaceae bacterium]